MQRTPNQIAHESNSRVMHSHHGQMTDLFPPIDPPQQNATTGAITNQATRVSQLEQSCYQCHPGTTTRCLRGAMFNGNMLCSDCHGSMLQVGNDFSSTVSPTSPGSFILNGGNFYDPASSQPRVPWANEPGCGSCHTGDARNNLFTASGTINTTTQASYVVNAKDTGVHADNIRLRQAFKPGDAKATPIVPANNRFAENTVPATFNGFANPGAGNPKLYTNCATCHGGTSRSNSCGTVLSRAQANRTLRGHAIKKGTPVGCMTCHNYSSWSSPTGTCASVVGPNGP